MKENIRKRISKQGKVWQIIVLLIISTVSIKAQSVSDTMYFAQPERHSISMPFHFVSNLIIIPVTINNSEPMFFILDTGLRTTTIMELAVGESLRLNFAYQTRIRGLGKGEALDVLFSDGNQLEMSGISGFNHDVHVLMRNDFNLSTRLGRRVHGIIGYDVFKDLIVEINYERKLITFHNPLHYNYKRQTRWMETFSIEILNDKPYIDAYLEVEDDEKMPVKMLIDTGASDALWIFRQTNENIGLPKNSIETYLGRGLNGEISGKKGRITSFSIGEYKFEQPTASFPDTNSVQKETLLRERNGSIGSEILRRFKVIIDYPNKRISLTPNKYYKDEFHYNMSGLEIYTPLPGIPFYQIADVQPKSPAAKAGLKPGDEILSINFKQAFEYTMNDIYLLLHGREGKRIRMKVMRGGETIKVKFRLEEVL